MSTVATDATAAEIPLDDISGCVWDIKRFALHDGPGVRTTVFFKGCRMRCPWCCNPESQRPRPEIAWLQDRCLGCDRCRESCPVGAVTLENGARRIDPELCDLCGACLAACPSGALNQVGRRVAVQQVLDEVMRDSVFYQRSGGGLTLSGGEPASQPAFAGELLRRYKEQEYGLHTAIETAGHVAWAELQSLLANTDLVFYDLKIMDPQAHRRATGVDNGLILENARRVAGSHVPMVIRLPVIPGYTDDEENVAAIAAFVAGLGAVRQIDLLPYHRLGEPKYARLGRGYPLSGTHQLDAWQLERLAQVVSQHGLTVQIGG